MNNQFLFYDIDGTLYLPWLKLSDKVVSALKEAKSRGHKLFLCTGRSLIGIPDEIRAIGFDGVIGGGGASIQIGSRIVEEQCIAPQDLRLLQQELERLDVAYELESNQGTFYSGKMHDLCEKYRDDTSGNSEMARLTHGKDFSLMHSMEEFRSDETAVAKVAFLMEGPEQAELLKKGLPDTFRMIIFGVAKDGTVNGELMPSDVNKGSAVIKICELLKHDLSDTIGFGDSRNDLEMLKTCGKAVVMEGAEEELKQIADYTCPSVEKDGVYYAMKVLQLC